MKNSIKVYSFLLMSLSVLLLANNLPAQGRHSHGGNWFGQRGTRFYGYPAYGSHFGYLPHSSISISFGGSPYFYGDGAFYRPFGGYYRLVPPPFGIHVGFLPYGFSSVYVGASLFYYYNGIFYRQYDEHSYEVVNPPMGAQVYNLPMGAKPVVINGEKFFELNGTYYREDADNKNQRVYTVVGKHGEINNSPISPAVPSIGDRLSQLPEGCKTVLIAGQKYFVAPDDTYYQEINDGNKTSYQVVGNASANKQ